MKCITIGTRASKLAMIQTHWVIERLREQWPDLEIAIEQIHTTGDHNRDVPLTQIGGDGVFVMEIERALAEKRIDLAVHSLKDLPTAQPEGLRVMVVGPREDVRDVLVWRQSIQGEQGQGEQGQGEQGQGEQGQGDHKGAPLLWTNGQDDQGQGEQGQGDPWQGDHKGTPLLWTNGQGDPWQGEQGQGDHKGTPLLWTNGQGDHKGAPLLWTNGQGEHGHQATPPTLLFAASYAQAACKEKGAPLLWTQCEDLFEHGRNDTLWGLSGMPNDATPLRIGTCSLRRVAQIRTLYPEAQILSLRGNVDTRLRKLDAGDYDAIVLAAAGLHRLGVDERLLDRMTYLTVEEMMPAPGQGALGLEIRDEPEMRELLAPMHDHATQAATNAERAFMRRLGAGCYLPVAAYGEIKAETLQLLGLVTSLDGERQVRVSQNICWTAESSIEQAEYLGVQLAEQALAQGADEIISAIDVTRGQERQHV